MSFLFSLPKKKISNVFKNKRVVGVPKKSINVVVPMWHTSYQYNFLRMSEKYPEINFFLFDWGGFRWKMNNRPVPSGVTVVDSLDVPDVDLVVCSQSTYATGEHRSVFEMSKRFCRKRGVPLVLKYSAIPSKPEDINFIRQNVDWFRFVVVNTPETGRRLGVPYRLNRVGVDPEEWYECDHSKGVFCDLPEDFGSVVGNNWWENGRDFYDVFSRSFPSVHRPFMFPNNKSFDDFRKIKASHGVYFNPTLMSANPESRLEALMMGQVVVSAEMVDDKEFFKGCPGIFFDIDPYRLGEFTKELIKDKKKLRELGKLNREWCIEHCHIEDFWDEWRLLIKEVVGR